MKKSKKTFKRVLAVALAALMVGSSLPLASFAATTDDISKLDVAINAYETKMNGTIYKNMQPAYDSYIKALKVKDAFTYGGKTDVDAVTVANELTQNTEKMVEWNSNAPIKSVTPSFRDDTDVQNYQDGVTHAGLVYAPQCTASNGMVDHTAMGAANTEFKICYPSYVIVYDGVNTPKMPVMSIGKNYEDVGKFCYGAFPVKSLTDFTDSNDIQLESYWRGDKGTTGESNKDVPNKMDFAYNYVNGKHKADTTFHEKNGSGYNNATGLQGHHKTANKGVEYVKYSWSMFKYTYYERYQANVMLFKGKLADNEYSRTIPSTTWYTAIGGDGDTAGVSGKTIAKTFVADKQPIYVINTATLNKSVNDAATKVGLANAKDITVDSAKFSALLGAIDNATNFDVTSGDFKTNTQQAVTDKATQIQTLKEAIDSSATSVAVDGTRNGYANLRQAITDSKAIKEAGQKDYSQETWNAFVAAYDACVAKMDALPTSTADYSDFADAQKLADALNTAKAQLKTTPKHEHVWGEWQQDADGVSHIRYCIAEGCTAPVASEKVLCSTTESAPEFKAPTEQETIGYKGRTHCTVCNRVLDKGENLDATAYFTALKNANAAKAEPNFEQKYTLASRTELLNAIEKYTLTFTAESTQNMIEEANTALVSATENLKLVPSLQKYNVNLVVVTNGVAGTVETIGKDQAYGTVFNVDVASKKGNGFVEKWEIINNDSNVTTPIYSSNDAIELTVSNNVTVKVYIAEKPADTKQYTKVTIYNQFGTIDNISYVENVGTPDLTQETITIGGKQYTAPAVTSYKFNRWVQVPAPSGEYQLKPEYSFIESSGSYAQINSYDNIVKINGKDQLSARYDSLITLTGGEAYAIVTKTGDIITYVNSDKIHVPHSAEIYIKAVNKADLANATTGVTGTLVRDKITNRPESYKGFAFNCAFNIPADATLVEAGLLTTDKAEIGTKISDFNMDNANVRKFASAKHSEMNEYTITIIGQFSQGFTMYGRSYVIYKDANGQLQTVYGNAEQITL